MCFPTVVQEAVWTHYCLNNVSPTKLTRNIVLLLQEGCQLKCLASISVVWKTHHCLCAIIVVDNWLNCRSAVSTDWSKKQMQQKKQWWLWNLRILQSLCISEKTTTTKKSIPCFCQPLLHNWYKDNKCAKKSGEDNKTVDAGLQQILNMSYFGINARRVCKESLLS